MKSSLALALFGIVAASADTFATSTYVSATATTTAANSVNPTTTINYISKLLQRAAPSSTSRIEKRSLFENHIVEHVLENNPTDISNFSLRFEKCQFVKEYDDGLAAHVKSSHSGTVLAKEDFVIFRLCPSNDSCHDSCSKDFGEYVVPLEDYLQETVSYQQHLQEEMCETCNENCGYENSLKADCDLCVNKCQMVEEMETNGYIDATEFINCQMIFDPLDDDLTPVYAGPVCANNGSKIKIGVFHDEECKIEIPDGYVEEYLTNRKGQHMKLSHALLKTVYGRNNCISCRNPEQQQANENSNKVLNLCQSLYRDSAKCEKPHGFANGMSVHEVYKNNQLAQEDTVCDFVETLKGEKALSKEHEIFVQKDNSKPTNPTTRSGQWMAQKGGNGPPTNSSTTKGQWLALCISIVASLGLAGAAILLRSNLMSSPNPMDLGANANYELIPMEGTYQQPHHI